MKLSCTFAIALGIRSNIETLSISWSHSKNYFNNLKLGFINYPLLLIKLILNIMYLSK